MVPGFKIKFISLAFLLPGYLRLGCMARDRGQIYEASDWFKEALQINQVNSSSGKPSLTLIISVCIA